VAVLGDVLGDRLDLLVRVAEVLPFQGFRDRYERLARGGLREKIVLTP